MERKVWRRPLAEVQKFVANEYCASCGTQGTTYLFNCNAGGGEWADIYLDNGTNLTDGSQHYFHACQAKHKASSMDDFQSGYMLLNGGSDETTYWVWDGFLQGHYEDYEKIPVIIWQGDGDIHATTTLDQDDWEIARS